MDKLTNFHEYFLRAGTRAASDASKSIAFLVQTVRKRWLLGVDFAAPRRVLRKAHYKPSDQ